MKYLLVLLSCFAMNAQKSVDLADAKIKAADYPAALKYCNQAILSSPSDPKLYGKRGFVYQQLKDYQKALDDYNKAIRLAPKSAEMLYARALFYLAINYADEALADSNAGLQVVKDNAAVTNKLLTSRGDAYGLKKNYEAAYADYLTVLNTTPEVSIRLICYTHIAAALVKLDRSDEAIAYLEKAVAEFPGYALGYNNLAFRYMSKGDYAKALFIYNNAIALSDKNANAKAGPFDPVSLALLYNNRGYAKLKMDDLEGAMADINKSIGLSADNSYAFRNRALVYIAQNKNSLACEDINKALALGFAESYGEELGKLKEAICAPK
jgi:tetratricopeptide (TPR) repeat protein